MVNRKGRNNMNKQKYFMTILLVGAVLLSGCGKTQNTTNSNSPQATANEDSGGNPAKTDTPQETGSFQNPDNQIIETPVPKNASVNLKKEYSDAERTFSILGMQEYKTIKTDKYKDKASKGKKYLVLFLKIYNKGNEKDYFNVNYLTAKVDGKETENTFLFNEPEGYPTIFANIEGGETTEGFIVWEVPENWKKLTVTYEGWKDIDGLTLDAELTKRDLKKPEQYSGGN